ncbi:RNA 2',3'-cyclic phosphodiesterase [Candidatus Methylobacter favarea]|uniref:RNA 2',3'-cyclic phosphodiesterase n=1 Tax=Candidatus Methylobacter favarea TaxID=2707345 RepID=A0A8S0Y9B8_9GAMM|nr:RNA 2',3'-cyclic phosphodiesterase [Candidatus Methylobacter favarea]CAA9889928.1 RNA 2',3'-cyclic phosphodiesterase [Candidatus Methylobacter favarea]
MANVSRLFFALWPDDTTRQKLVRLCQSIQAKEFKWVLPQNLHVTLVFLGNIDTSAELLIKKSAAAISAEPFVVTFDRLTYWKKPKVLCLASRQPPPSKLMILVEALGLAVENCGLQIDARPYAPHITLARHGNAWVDQDCEPVVWQANSFCLVESCSKAGGVFYKVIEQWPFEAGSLA